MNIESVYNNRYKIAPEFVENFEPKYDLNTIEKLGLEAVAVEFICQHSIEEYGYNQKPEEIRSFIMWHNYYVDILDGVYDTYEFDGHLVDHFWMTENGIPMLTAYEIPEDCEDWRDEDYCNFDTVVFRLD